MEGLESKIGVEGGREIKIKLTSDAVKEVDRLKEVTKLTQADIFRKSLLAFRILVDAYEQGAEVFYRIPGKKEVTEIKKFY